MKIGHYQLECVAGDFDANVAKVLFGLERAEQEGIEIISFPESFLTGFFSDESAARRHSLVTGDERFKKFLHQTKHYPSVFIVGYNELRAGNLYNTVLIAQHGELWGTYSKAFPEPYFKPGRDFPVFKYRDVTFGVIICADGGYIEPARILALKGAQIIFAPHYNYITASHLIGHFQHVRSDHIARATENGVWFVRGNNVTISEEKGLEYEGVGYGDSYVLDPFGEMIVRSQRHVEQLLSADVNFNNFPTTYRDRSRRSGNELGEVLRETLRV
jgi:predicted amidohydrolase